MPHPQSRFATGHDLWGFPAVYLFMVLGWWVFGVPLTAESLLWLAAVTVVLGTLFLLVRYQLRAHSARSRT